MDDEDEDELTSQIAPVSQHQLWQFPAVSRLLSTIGPPPHSLFTMISTFYKKTKMGVRMSLLKECCVSCKFALAIDDRDVTESNHDDLAMRLANLELLTRRYHMQPGGLAAQRLTVELPAQPLSP